MGSSDFLQEELTMEAKSVGATGFNVMIFLIFLFLYVPMAILVIFSFNDGLFPSPWQGFTVKWYSELFHSPAVWDAFYNSLIVAVSATCLSLLFALGLVYYESHERMIGSWVYLFYGTIFVPEVVLAIGLLSFLSFCSVPLGLTTLIAGHTLLGLGYAVPIVYASYHTLDATLREASRDLGATNSQTFFKITVPLLRIPLLVCALLVFIISFDDFIVSYFCAGSEAQTLSLYIYSMIRTGISPVINALSTLLLALSGLLVFMFCSLSLRSNLW